MTTATANAFPRKRFFLEMFTRDISLEDCILDLIDNSIDSLVRIKDLDPARKIFSKRTSRKLPAAASHKVELVLSDKVVTIHDNCGGIPVDLVENEVFSFGHDDSAVLGQLGAYGIGLKRAIFKISEQFSMESRTRQGGFTAALNISEWAKRDETKEDWRIPIEYVKGTKDDRESGTDIKFLTLRDEVRMRLRDPAFLGRLNRSIAQTYALFLEDAVRVTVNAEAIEPWEIPIGESEKIKPGQTQFSKGEVNVRIIAALAARRPEWTYDRAGWYVLCNGRVVVAADKSELTGWGIGLPNFHSKYNGFVGAAIFSSRNPLALPWTTTKRGLNKESAVYQSAIREMTLLAKPIISFLNDMYRSEALEEPTERKMAEQVKQSDLRVLTARRPSTFRVEKPSAPRKTTVRIQYDAEMADVENVKKAIRQPRWGANKVGKYTFDYFVKTECPQ